MDTSPLMTTVSNCVSQQKSVHYSISPYCDLNNAGLHWYYLKAYLMDWPNLVYKRHTNIQYYLCQLTTFCFFFRFVSVLYFFGLYKQSSELCESVDVGNCLQLVYLLPYYSAALNTCWRNSLLSQYQWCIVIYFPVSLYFYQCGTDKEYCLKLP